MSKAVRNTPRREALSPRKTGVNKAMEQASVREFADSTTMILISRVGMAFGVPLMLMAMVWVVSSMNQLQIDVSVMKSQISAGVEDRYHGSDAAKDFALRDALIRRNSDDISRVTQIQGVLAARVDALETHAPDK